MLHNLAKYADERYRTIISRVAFVSLFEKCTYLKFGPVTVKYLCRQRALLQILDAISCLSSFKTRSTGFISSGPAASSGFRFNNNLSAPFRSMKISGFKGTYISNNQNCYSE